MKRVKYRLWCNNKKEWEKDEWHLTPDGIIIDTRRNIEMKKETHFLNQFTGLFDKQGVEIYEGDVVTTPYRDTNGYIYYSAPTFGLKDKIGVCVDFTWEDFNEFEVIGNIYEHKHLIK